jgi:FkbM family methyltransferase
MTKLLRAVRRLVRLVGFDIRRVGHYLLLMHLGGDAENGTLGPDPLDQYLFERRLAHVLQRLHIDCVLDVGGNRGQYGLKLRSIGYQGHIVSFEPVRDAFESLWAVASHDPRWTVHQLALGAEEGRASIHVTKGSDFSSFLVPTAYAIERFPASAPVERIEQVDVRRLDRVLPSVIAHLDHPRLFLKLDTQGYDLEVFAGAGREVDRLLGLQSELSVVPLYEDVPTILEGLHVYRSHGFDLSALSPVARDPSTARVLEYDCLMLRPADVARAVPPITPQQVRAGAFL